MRLLVRGKKRIQVTGVDDADCIAGQLLERSLPVRSNTAVHFSQEGDPEDAGAVEAKAQLPLQRL